MKSGLVALLKGESTISSLTSKVYITKAPQTATMPYIVIELTDTEEFGSLDGTGALRRVTFAIDCHSELSTEAETIGKSVRDFIDDYTGTAGSFTIDAVNLGQEISDYQPPKDASDKGTHTVTLLVDIFYQDT
jgi:hypothetical protein